jgi:gamma-glutamyl phosphate reductase
MEIQELARSAKAASIDLAACGAELKNAGLRAIAEALTANTPAIVAANKIDIERSEKENLEAPLLKRLKFDESKIKVVVEGINSLIGLTEIEQWDIFKKDELERTYLKISQEDSIVMRVEFDKIHDKLIFKIK